MCHAPDHIEVGEGGLDHDHVRAFGDVEARFPDGFAQVCRVHLIAAAVTELGRRAGGLPEWTVEGRRVLGRIREDGAVLETGPVERRADRTDLPVHHPGRSDHVRACLRLRDGNPPVDLEGGIVVHRAILHDPAVSVVGVLAEA